MATGLEHTYPPYRFGACEVHPGLRQVRLSGTPRDAQPKTFDLLLYLIENRHRVVEKDELLENLWPGKIVTESALTQVVRKARSLVGDAGNRQAIIKTVLRRGFRFVATLDIGASGKAPHVAMIPVEISFAVLPFV